VIRASFYQIGSQPEDVTISWEPRGTQLIATQFDPAQYGESGPSLTRVGSGQPVHADFGGVRFDFDSMLATSAQGKSVPATPVENAPALGGGAPAHAAGAQRRPRSRPVT
jgi:hypothetical protein